MGLFDKVRDLVTGVGTARPDRPERARGAGKVEAEAGAKADRPVTAADGATAERDADEVGQEGRPDELRTHTVARGDTLVAIASRYGVDWREMAALNGLDNPDLIYAGQVFRVPDA